MPLSPVFASSSDLPRANPHARKPLAGNADVNRLRWMLRSEVFVNLRKLKDTSGKYLLEPDPTQAGVYRLLGLPVTVTNRIPFNLGAGGNETAVVLWDPAQVAVARDLSPSVKLLDQTYAQFDQQAIRVVAHYDAAPLNPDSIVVMRGVTG
jgi:HK97 family phage major capsid protein